MIQEIDIATKAVFLCTFGIGVFTGATISLIIQALKESNRRNREC